MKRYLVIPVCFLLCLGCSLRSPFYATLADAGKIADPKSIQLRCAQDGSYLPPEETYALGAFFHWGHEHSVRIQDWKAIGNEEEPYKESVAVVIVPYVANTHTSKQYVFVPDPAEKQHGYVLSCQDSSSLEHPSNYPSLLLTPSSGEDASDSEKKALQRELVNFLRETPDREFLVPPLGSDDGFKVAANYGEDGVSEVNCIFHEKKVGDLSQLLEIILSQQMVSFLNSWKYGTVSVVPRGVESEKNLAFSYSPQGAQETRAVSLKPEPREDPQTDQATQTEQQAQESENVSLSEQSQEPPTNETPVKNDAGPKDSSSGEPQLSLIEIALPELFQDIDISTKMTLDPCQVHSKIQQSPENPLLYSATCQGDRLPTALHIQGFQTIPVTAPAEKHTLKISVDSASLIADVSVSLPEDAALTYKLGDQEIAPGEREKRLLMPVTASPAILEMTTTSSDVSACNFSTPVPLQDILEKKNILLTPVCRNNLIRWPEHWATPAILKQGGCVKAEFPVEQSQLECLRKQEDELILSWGKGWQPITISREQLNETEGYQISLAQFAPVWPLQADDPLLQPAENAGGTPCEAPPRYEPVAVHYCVGEATCRSARLEPNAMTLPDIGLAGWKQIDPLPSIIRIELKKTSHNPLYKDTQYLQLRPVDAPPSQHLETLIAEADWIEQLPVAIDPETSTVPFSSNAKFIVFHDKQSCEKGLLTGAAQSVAYTATAIGMKPFLANPCDYAAILKGNRWVSPCTQGEKQEGNVVFPMKSNRIEGKRKLLVIADSKILGQSGRGPAIQGAVMDWLQELQDSESRIPLNLYVVQGDNEVNDVLYGEDLERLVYSSDDGAIPTIVGKISKLTFEGEGFRPLENLITVKQIAEAYQDEIGKIVFFTDTESLPEQIEDSQTGILWGWKQDGVDVTVVTDHNCEKWGYRDLVKCQLIPEFPEKEEIRRILGQL